MSNAEKIEKLAYKFKFVPMSEGRKGSVESELLFLVMREMKLMTSSGEINEEYYDGEILSKSYESAMNDYGMQDETTAEIVPFLKIIRSHYNLNSRSLLKKQMKEKDGVAYKLSENSIKLFLKETARELHCKDFKMPRNVKNHDAVVKLLKEMGADDRILKAFEDVFGERHSVSDTVSSSSEDGVPSGNLSDSTGLNEFSDRELIEYRICDSIDASMAKILNKTEKKFARYFLTIIYGQNTIQSVIIADCIERYIDKEFLDYYLGHIGDGEDDCHILAGYLDVTLGSVESRLREARKNFARYGL